MGDIERMGAIPIDAQCLIDLCVELAALRFLEHVLRASISGELLKDNELIGVSTDTVLAILDKIPRR